MKSSEIRVLRVNRPSPFSFRSKCPTCRLLGAQSGRSFQPCSHFLRLALLRCRAPLCTIAERDRKGLAVPPQSFGHRLAGYTGLPKTTRSGPSARSLLPIRAGVGSLYGATAGTHIALWYTVDPQTAKLPQTLRRHLLKHGTAAHRVCASVDPRIGIRIYGADVRIAECRPCGLCLSECLPEIGVSGLLPSRPAWSRANPGRVYSTITP
jgi:hypothetical protein